MTKEIKEITIVECTILSINFMIYSYATFRYVGTLWWAGRVNHYSTPPFCVDKTRKMFLLRLKRIADSEDNYSQVGELIEDLQNDPMYSIFTAYHSELDYHLHNWTPKISHEIIVQAVKNYQTPQNLSQKIKIMLWFFKNWITWFGITLAVYKVNNMIIYGF